MLRLQVKHHFTYSGAGRSIEYMLCIRKLSLIPFIVFLLMLACSAQLYGEPIRPEWIPFQSVEPRPDRASELPQAAANLFITQIRSNNPLHMSMAVSGIRNLVQDEVVTAYDPAVQDLLMMIISRAELSIARDAVSLMAAGGYNARDQLLLLVRQSPDSVVAAEAAFALQGIDIHRSGQEILVQRLRINRNTQQDNRLAYALLVLVHEEAERRDIIDPLIEELINHAVSSFVYDVRRKALDIVRLLEEK